MRNLIALILLTSCTASPYLVVQYVHENKALCRNAEGLEITASIDDKVITNKGDTLLHIGNFNYYNINSKQP